MMYVLNFLSYKWLLPFILSFCLFLTFSTLSFSQGIRKHYTELTDLERQAYITALDELIDNGTTEVFVDYHADPDLDGNPGNSSIGPDTDSPIHNVAIFLPWHRQFIWEFEKELQNEDPNVTIPYWDWTGQSDPSGVTSESKVSPLWHNGTNNQLSALNWSDGLIGKYNLDPALNLRRILVGGAPDLNLATRVNNLLTQSQFLNWNTFRNELEGPIHGPPHSWTSVVMQDPMISPRDPSFYLHHSMVDKIWQQWTVQGNSSILGSSMPTFTSVNPNSIVDSRTLGIFYSDAIAQQTTLEQYTVMNNTLLTEKFVYQYLIVAENDFIVPSGGDAELRSCEKIVLDENFKVQLGGSFFAMVDEDCDFGTASRVAAVVQDEHIRPVEAETGNRPWSSVKAYPNPFMGTALQLEFTFEQAETVSLEVTNTFGQVLQQPVTSEFLNAGNHEYTLKDFSLSPGIYYLVLRTASGVTESFRIVKSK